MHDAYELSKFFADSDLSDKTEVLLELCQREPDLLLDVIREIAGDPWKRQCRDLLADGQKLGAIKLCRQITGWALKEAKDAVEAL